LESDLFGLYSKAEKDNKDNRTFINGVSFIFMTRASFGNLSLDYDGGQKNTHSKVVLENILFGNNRIP
jgi:hypothetical protein